MIQIDSEHRIFVNAVLGSIIIACQSVLVFGNGSDLVGFLICLATAAVAIRIDCVDWFFGKWIKGD